MATKKSSASRSKLPAHKPQPKSGAANARSRTKQPASSSLPGPFSLPKLSNKKKPAGKRSSSHSPWQWNAISNERKLDILGIALALIGFLTILSLISTQRSSITGWWIHAISQIAGWGTFVLPLALLVLGIWLVLRNVERLPLLSAERVSGILLLYINLLVWLHVIGKGGWELAQSGQGGGYIGAFFEQILVKSVGQAGTYIVLAAWLLIAMGLTLDISIPDLFGKIQPILERIQEDWERNQAAKRAERIASIRAQQQNQPIGQQHNAATPPNPQSPHGYQPIPAAGSAHSNQMVPEQRGAASQRPPAQNPQPAQSATNAITKNETPVKTDPGLQPSVTQGTAAGKWQLPELKTILDPVMLISLENNIDQERADLIEETLASFGAPSKIVEIKRGPTITQFGVEPQFVENRNGRTRVRVSKIANLADDLALALAAPRIRIQAPVPGHSFVGIEVPNSESSRVTLLEVLDSKNFTHKKSPLRIALGMNVSGEPIASDLAGLPHLLIAGTTGSGKSVCVNSILCCLLLNNTPAELRMILVDPKRVELTGYNGIPHLLAPVITDTDKVVGALQWVQREMDARYHRFSQVGSRNIQDYNKNHSDKLPYMVVIIDELADLMMLAPDETERSLTRLAQLSRATGIHLILATQRPSTDVVTGLIKANFPARIAFAVASNVDSRVILDQPGAERLLGRGDMLFQAPDAAAPVRLQGVYITDQEIARTVDFWKIQAMNIGSETPSTGSHPAQPVQGLPVDTALKQVPLFDQIENSDDDPMFKEAIDLVRREGRASITMLQRRLRIGYTRAARMIDQLEDEGIISPPLPNSNAREILDYGQAGPPEDDGY